MKISHLAAKYKTDRGRLKAAMEEAGITGVDGEYDEHEVDALWNGSTIEPGYLLLSKTLTKIGIARSTFVSWLKDNGYKTKKFYLYGRWEHFISEDVWMKYLERRYSKRVPLTIACEYLDMDCGAIREALSHKHIPGDYSSGEWYVSISELKAIMPRIIEREVRSVGRGLPMSFEELATVIRNAAKVSPETAFGIYYAHHNWSKANGYKSYDFHELIGKVIQ